MALNRRPLSMRGLRTFCAAARHSTLRAAAEELFITPSAVSHQIKKLEGELGFSLFEKQGRQLRLTLAGSKLYEQTSESLLRLESAVAVIQANHSKAVLRVSVQPFFGSELLMPMLQEFTGQNPNIELEIDASDDSTQKHSGAFDVSIRLFREPPETLSVHKLFPLTLVPACSPGLRQTLENSPGSASAPFPVVVHSRRPSAWKTWADECGIQLPGTGGVLRMDSMNAVVQAAERGLGVGLVPLQLTGSAFASGRLVRLFEHALKTSDAYYLVHHEDSSERTDVQLFTRWVMDCFADVDA